jgi:hypothetical protein
VAAIVATYPTPISLFRAYEATITTALNAPAPQAGIGATAAARGLLAGLQQGSGQRLGASKAAAVFDALFANGWKLAQQQEGR